MIAGSRQEAGSFAAGSPAARGKPGSARRLRERVRAAWTAYRIFITRLDRLLRFPRRIRFTRAGVLFSLGAFAVGFAAINTGNNLLYLLLGAMLGFITLSGWLSEQVIRRLDVRRAIPRGITVGRPARIDYEVTNRRKRIPTLALEIAEQGLPGKAFVTSVAPGETATTRSVNHFIRRGVYPLDTLTLSTGFPFGLFQKERDLHVTGELLVWPSTGRHVREPSLAGGSARGTTNMRARTAGTRGEYRSLRDYRPGDDLKDIHWRSTARLGGPVIREYEEDDGTSIWICLDTRNPPSDAAEVAVEIAAALAAGAEARSRRFGLATPDGIVDLGRGVGQLERVLDALARLDFDVENDRVAPPDSPERCVLVSVRGGADPGFGDHFSVMRTGRDHRPASAGWARAIA